jgi:hypothetical protein
VKAKAAEGESEGPLGAPEVGRCTPAPGGAGHGTYSSSKCTTARGKKPYEWLPGTAKHGLKTHLATGTVTLQTTTRVKVTCTGESGEGELAGAKHIHGLTLKLTGCTEGAQSCTSSGAAAGEIRTGALSGLLGIEKLGATHAKDKAALALYPYMHTGTFTAFPVRAHEAEGAEREELWRLVNDNYPGYELYQQRAGARRIPVMVLTPRWVGRRAVRHSRTERV